MSFPVLSEYYALFTKTLGSNGGNLPGAIAVVAKAAEARGSEKWRLKYDDACAVLRAPDSTNDGGPADLAEEIRTLLHNNTVYAEGQVEAEAALSTAEIKGMERAAQIAKNTRINDADAALCGNKDAVRIHNGVCNEIASNILHDAEKLKKDQP